MISLQANTIGLTELLISFSIVMMMLSFVAERIANFIKLHFNGKSLRVPYPHNFLKKNNKIKLSLKGQPIILASKQPTIVAEKQREYRILTINILVGIIVAIAANANFFDLIGSITTIPDSKNPILKGWTVKTITDDIWLVIFGGVYLGFFLVSLALMSFKRPNSSNKEHPNKKIIRPFVVVCIIGGILLILAVIGHLYNPTNNATIEIFADGVFTVVEFTIGFLLTGAFLSLGSKFWHDLLDILFKSKNVQQRLNEKSTYTDYDSADKLMALANTSHYEVASKLLEKYRDQIDKIDDVVSVGLNSVLDRNTGLYKRLIEVEFTSAAAQSKIQTLMKEGSISINHNTFYLRDYLKPLYTAELIPANMGMVVGTGSDLKTKITEQKPICYAYNSKSKTNKGSFGLYENTQGEIFAVSNFHVFASEDDLPLLKAPKPGQFVSDIHVKLHIGNKKFDAEMVEELPERDYSRAKVIDANTSIVPLYRKMVNAEWLENPETNEMTMFGATTKRVRFDHLKHLTSCKINYGSFTKEYWLYKITSLSHQNINKGDSGSVLYYKEDSNDNVLTKGMIVAKSDNYAYMFELNTPI